MRLVAVAFPGGRCRRLLLHSPDRICTPITSDPERTLFCLSFNLTSSLKQPRLSEGDGHESGNLGRIGWGEEGLWERGEENDAAREAEVWVRSPHLPPGSLNLPPAASDQPRILLFTDSCPSILIPLSCAAPMVWVWEPTPTTGAAPVCEWVCDGMRKSRAPLHL